MLRETAQERKEKRERDGERKPPAERPRESGPAAARPRGLAPPTGIRRQTEKTPPLPQTPGGAGGHSDNGLEDFPALRNGM